MTKGYKIGLLTILCLGAGVLWSVRTRRKTEEENESLVSKEKRLYQEKEDNFFNTPVKIEQLVDPVKPWIPTKEPSKILLEDKKGHRFDLDSYYDMLINDFNRTQITVCNESNEDRKVTIWGGNACSPVSPPLPTDLNEQVLIETIDLTAIDPNSGLIPQQPQDIAINNSNGYLYTVNQLSNTVTVTNLNGDLVAQTLLNQNYLGFASPVAITIDPQTGFAYIAGSVSNLVYVMDTNFNIVQEIEVEVRPMDVIYNPVNGLIYVANMVSNSLSVIDPELNDIVTTIPVGESPTSLAINTDSGEIYAANSEGSSIQAIDALHLAYQVISIFVNPIDILYNPSNGLVYIASDEVDDIIYFDPAQLPNPTLNFISGTNNPISLSFDPRNNYIYVVNGETSSTTAITTNNNVKNGNTYGGSTIVVDPNKDVLYVSNPGTNTIEVWGVNEESGFVTINADYPMIREEFKNNPVILKHAKFINKGPNGQNLLTISEKSPSGKISSDVISLNKYDSPQNSTKVAELFEIEKHVIDGHTTWDMILSPGQCCSMMLYYKQFNRKEQFIN